VKFSKENVFFIRPAVCFKFETEIVKSNSEKIKTQ